MIGYRAEIAQIHMLSARNIGLRSYIDHLAVLSAFDFARKLML